MDREAIENQIAKFQQALDDPWRPIRNAQNGCDPIITEAETRQLRCAIEELTSKLSSHHRGTE